MAFQDKVCVLWALVMPVPRPSRTPWPYAELKLLQCLLYVAIFAGFGKRCSRERKIAMLANHDSSSAKMKKPFGAGAESGQDCIGGA